MHIIASIGAGWIIGGSLAREDPIGVFVGIGLLVATMVMIVMGAQ